MEMVNIISNLTCWTNEPCETFLNSERVETMEIPKFDPCTCGGGILEFTPYYRPFQADTFKVFLITSIGINENVIELHEGVDYKFSESTGKLKISVSPYIKDDACGCPENSRLAIYYDAGYELLPECLLQLFCDLLHVITRKNTCDCQACQQCTQVDNNEGYVEFTEGDDVSPKLDKWLNILVSNGYELALGQMSLCSFTKQKIWGVVC